MNSLYILIPLAVVLVVIALRLFVWAVRNGQYDDLEMEGRRILFDEQTGPADPPSPAIGREVGTDSQTAEAKGVAQPDCSDK